VSAVAHSPISSDLDNILSGYLTSYVASITSRGKVGCAPVTMNVRATGAQDSRRILSNITVYNYDTTHLQENPQRLG